MKKHKPLHINIPEPCNQNWGDMSADKDGRYCTQCSKTVLDFSCMTDAELIRYFETKPVNICGRFGTAQLHRDIILPKPRRFCSAFYQKAAATVLAILSFRFSTAQVQKKPATVPATQAITNHSKPSSDNVILSGRVTKNYSQPVANAKVSFDGLMETYTDAEGRFTLQLKPEMMGSHNLYFSATGLMRAVRNFNPVMGSTEYNVNMDNPDECMYSFHSMGMPVINSNLHDFPSLPFAKNEAALSPDDKLILATVAEHMRTEPQMVIKLVAYGEGITGTKRAAQKLKLISNYLVKENGISEKRIKRQIEKISGVKLVDILQEEE